jgi:ABC-type bacteriocin/lantibiotic exporter with double-glycine peptidase domain
MQTDTKTKKQPLYKYLLSSKKQIMLLIFLVITVTANQLYKFSIYKTLTSTVTNIDTNDLTDQTVGSISTALWILFGKLIFTHIYDVIANYFMKIMVIKTAKNAFNDLVEKLVYFKIDFFDQYKKKDLMDIWNAIQQLTIVVFEFILDVPQTIVYLVFYTYSIYTFSQYTMMMVFGINAIILLITQPISNRLDKERLERLEHEKDIRNRFYEMVSYVPYIKTSCSENNEINRVSGGYDNYYKHRKSALKLMGLNECLGNVINDALMLVVYLMGIQYVLSSDIKTGDIIFIAIHIGNFHKKVINIKSMKSYYNQVKPGLDMLRDIINYDSSERDQLNDNNNLYTNKNTNTIVKLDNKPKMEFQNVTFGYSRDNMVFRNFSFKVLPQQINVLIGENGSGKSTTIKLFMRLYELSDDSGAIYYDSIDIRNYPLLKLRRNISLVTQDPTLFDNTLWYNLTYGLDDTKIEDNVLGLCELMGIREWVKENKDMRIGFQGAILSGGQKKKVQLVNVLSRDSDVIVFDEPTNNLDPETVSWFIDFLDKIAYSAHNTVIVITHDKRLLVNADHVVSLDKEE